VLGILRFLIGDGGKERAAWKVCDLLGIGLLWELLAFGLVLRAFIVCKAALAFVHCLLCYVLLVPCVSLLPRHWVGSFVHFACSTMGMIALVSFGLALSVPYLGSRSGTN
jgi:hypothetical protein